MTRAASQSSLRFLGLLAAASLFWGGHALAQTSDGLRTAQAQSAYAEWRKLSQTEVNCIDRSLQGRGTRLWSVIQRGVGPSNAALAGVRAACGVQARSQSAPAATSPSQALASADSAKVTVKPVVVVETTAADKAAAEKVAADKAASERAVQEKAAREKAAQEKVAAEKAAAERIAADKAEAEKAVAQVVAAKAATEPAKPSAERASADASPAPVDAGPPQRDNERDTVMAMHAATAAELRTSFVYGLAAGPILFGLGGIAFLLIQRRRNTTPRQPDSAMQERLVTAVIAELKRRDNTASA
jgi:hypothetical protein